MVDVSMTGEPPLRPRGREEQSDRRERQVAEGSAAARVCTRSAQLASALLLGRRTPAARRRPSDRPVASSSTICSRQD
jgi:hypothetical protein